jgi:hypothetical protein
MTHDPSNIPQQLIGFWKVVGGDYPLTDEYRPDGTLIQHVGDRTSDPIAFRVEGNHLISSLEQPDGTTSEQRAQFELSEDKLTFIEKMARNAIFSEFEMSSPYRSRGSRIGDFGDEHTA